ncbi:MAG: hypothetical protein JSW39_26975 [Desulfobacterales bacterium]|nr:MAG: hypothetical protein JSW39_26975 [Desulfobacterales bacterium]
MDDSRQSEAEIQRIDEFDDEIELIDILLVIWRHRYLIMGGTLACTLIVAVLSLLMPKIYSVDMVLRPGILEIGGDGKNVYIDTAENIKALIEAETFNKEILQKLKESNGDDIPESLEFEVNIPKDSNAIKVRYETADIKQGIMILDYLKDFFLEEYRKLVTYYKNEYEMKLRLKRNEISKLEVVKNTYARNIENLTKRVAELTSEIEVINSNTRQLNKERNKFISERSHENSILAAMLYSNTIQQNLALANDYKNQINSYELDKEEEIKKLKESESQIRQFLEEIENLEYKRGNIQNIQTLQRPDSSPFPIKPQKRLYVLFAAGVGLLMMLIVAFFLEYLSRYKSSQTS